ncbi:uncharacterized protein MJAP1_001937 [Malassezia japonica]|uniref:NADH dehydrogenase [ubiquinone] 1 beta subcomplex subunit 4 n=1 Tax=Malassezia japonica TaxID=223818 RepID=A0AAF0JFH9_9BASI|nr:uncharacterized protein MJAP1_001937 [Malassezia japonica]WFD38971.1 hypothetical protein MJAP1_001937 [Malassezia japonica]
MYQRFRWTPKNTPLLLLWGITVPAATLYMISQTNDKWDYTGKKKDQSLLRKAPQPEAEQ